MLVGIAEAGFLPGILVYLTWWFPAYHRARANALFMIAMPVTMMLGSILSGYILAMDGLWNLKGWQWLFLLEGLPSVVLGVVTWFYLNDTPAQATWLDEDEKQALKTMIAREQQVVHCPTGRAATARCNSAACGARSARRRCCSTRWPTSA